MQLPPRCICCLRLLEDMAPPHVHLPSGSGQVWARACCQCCPVLRATTVSESTKPGSLRLAAVQQRLTHGQCRDTMSEQRRPERNQLSAVRFGPASSEACQTQPESVDFVQKGAQPPLSGSKFNNMSGNDMSHISLVTLGQLPEDMVAIVGQPVSPPQLARPRKSKS